ncbi:MAG: hypothetical protein ACFCD0_27280, partial [Gemmataceae bacterium]
MLEARDCPALNYFFSPTGLSIMGTPDNANGGLTVNVTAPNLITIMDGAATPLMNIPFGGNLRITTSGADDIVNIVLGAGAGISGNLDVNTNGGVDNVMVTGSGGNTIGGNVNYTGVNTTGAAFTNVIIGGSLTMNSATENFDQTAVFTATTIGGNFTYLGGNNPLSENITFGTTTVGGNAYVNMAGGVNAFLLTDPTSTIGGSLTFVGGSSDDTVQLDGFVGGSVNLQLSGSLLAGNSVTVAATGGVGGSFTVFGGF